MAVTSLPNNRRARCILLWAAGVFLACHLSGGVLLDYCWPEVRFPTAAYLFDALRARGPAPDVVALGSSRIGLGFSAREAGSALRRCFPAARPITVFNAAVPSGDLATSDYVLEQILRQGLRPSVVVIEVTPEVVNRYNDWIGFDIDRLLRWDQLPTYLPDIIAAETLRRLLIHRLFPLHVYRSAIRASLLRIPGRWVDFTPVTKSPLGPTLKSDQSGLDSQGLFGDIFEYLEVNTVHNTGPSDNPADILIYQHWFRRYEIGGTSAASLERLLRRCRDNAITPVLVTVPLSEGYRHCYTPQIDAAFAAYMSAVSRRYDCPFLDYRALAPDRMFFDHTHLIPEGSRMLTRKLLRDAVIPAWEERHR